MSECKCRICQKEPTAFPVVCVECFEQLQTDLDKTREDIKWVINDMQYKSPEQMFDMVHTRWIPHLKIILPEE